MTSFALSFSAMNILVETKLYSWIVEQNVGWAAFEVLVGAIRSDGGPPEPDADQREDRSWLLAGLKVCGRPCVTSTNLGCRDGVLHEVSAWSGNAIMKRAANNNLPKGQLIVVPHAYVPGQRLSDLQTGTKQDRIGTALRAMYTDLLQQSLTPQLVKLVRQIEARVETSRHAG